MQLPNLSSSSLSHFSKGYPIHPLTIQANNLDVILDSSLFPIVLTTLRSNPQASQLCLQNTPQVCPHISIYAFIHMVPNWATASAYAPYSLSPTLQLK